MIKVEIKKNEKKQEYQVWLNGGIHATFDANIFLRQQIFAYVKKTFKPLSEEVKEELSIKDLTGEAIMVCRECGSENVESKEWFNWKTGDSDAISSDSSDNWCNDCDAHVKLEIKEEEKNG